MTFKGKVTAVMLVALVIVYGWYFVQVLLEASTTPVEDIAYQAGLLVVVVVLVVLSVIGISVLAALARREAQEDEDERDRLIEMRGDQVGGYLLAIGALVALALAMLEFQYFWIANTILAGLVLSEIGKAIVMLSAYRRGF
jgi:putative copper export protein